MPTYEYRCDACDNKWEEFQSIKAEPTKKCPKCKKSKAERIISAGGGIIFKGSGFYQTDYRSESYKKGAEAAKKASDTSTATSSDSAKTDSGKTETKTTPTPKKESVD
jgi:putative FmdB family regulatory protein